MSKSENLNWTKSFGSHSQLSVIQNHEEKKKKNQVAYMKNNINLPPYSPPPPKENINNNNIPINEIIINVLINK